MTTTLSKRTVEEMATSIVTQMVGITPEDLDAVLYAVRRLGQSPHTPGIVPPFIFYIEGK